MALGSAAVFIAACLTSGLLTALSIRLASKTGLLDKPDARKVHTQATPRLGGIGIVGGTLVVGCTAVAWHFVNPTDTAAVATSAQAYLGVLLGTFCIFGVGLCDDLFGVPSRIKLVALIAAALAVCGAGSVVEAVRTDSSVLLDISQVSWLVTVLWIIGIAVAFNFIDGLDGLAGGLGLITSLALAAYLLAAGHPLEAVPPLALAGSLVGFLYFNWRPARTFMGDSGSMTVGFLIGALTVTANPVVGTMRGMIIPVLGVSVAIVDAAITIFRRHYQQRRSIFSAERGHIHHRLLDRGLQHHQAVVVLHCVSIAAVLLGAIALNFEGWTTFSGLVFVVPLLGLLFHSAGSVQTNDMIDAIRRKRSADRSSRRFEREFESLQLEYDAAKDFPGWWKVTCEAAERLEFTSVELPVDAPYADSKTIYRWCGSELDADAEHLDAKIPVTLFGASEPVQIASIRVKATDRLESAGHRLALFTRLFAENGRDSLRNVYYAKRSKWAIAKIFPKCELGKVNVAIVHDFYDSQGGPRRVLEQLVDIFPHADLFGVTDFLSDTDRTFIHEKSVVTTFVQRLPFASKRPFAYLPLMPLAIEQLDLSRYDLVVSSSQLVAKGVTTGPKQLHISYCHTPLNYREDLYAAPRPLHGSPMRLLAAAVRHRVRNWDLRASNSVDQFIASSKHSARRIEKLYRRPAAIIGPPVNTDVFVPATTTDTNEEYYLAVSRLVPQKRIQVMVEAFAQLPDRKLIIIGDGTDHRRLRRLAPTNVEFLGPQDTATVVKYMQWAKAFITATDDDYTLTCLEAHACGTPVIAFRTGSITDFVTPGPMGYFFDEPTPQSLCDALDRFESAGPVDDLDRKAVRQRAERFSTEHFVERFTDVVRREIRSRWVHRLEPQPGGSRLDIQETANRSPISQVSPAADPATTAK